VHAGALGWVGFLTFGMIYWLAPRLYQTRLWSPRLAETHFWIGTVGILLYVVAIYAGGLMQGLMWRAFDDTGRLMYPDFVETMARLMPMYVVRAIGGTLYLAGVVLLGLNAFMTWRRRPVDYEVAVHEAPPLPALAPAPAASGSVLVRVRRAAWHRRWEALPLTFSVWVAIAVITASLFEIVPMFLSRGTVPTIAAVKPYTPLEVYGRDVYIAEGCGNCHSQMVRPIRAETMRYGEYSKPGEFVYDRPFLWGSRRIGPDLHRVGGKYPHLWHVRHMADPRSTTPQSIMPAYPWLATTAVDFTAVPARVAALARVGVPYSEREQREAAPLAREQDSRIADEIVQQGGPAGLAATELVALIGYLQRLGTDIKASRASAQR
jgi:cytochrome c oxidase cbb3-type subunit I/II